MKKLNQNGSGALFVIVIVVILVVGFYYLYRHKDSGQTIDNFDECIAADGSLQESYAEVCHSSDGRQFVNPKQAFDKVQ